MVRGMAVTSLLHHEGRRNKSLCNSLFAFLFPFCNRYFHSNCFHCYGDPSTWPESNRGSSWMQISLLLKLYTCKWNLKTMPLINEDTHLSTKKNLFFNREFRSQPFSFLICQNATKFVLLSFFTLIEILLKKNCSKWRLKIANCPLPVAVRGSKT